MLNETAQYLAPQALSCRRMLCVSMCLEHTIILVDDLEVHKVHLSNLVDDLEVHKVHLSNIAAESVIDEIYTAFHIVLPRAIQHSSLARKLDFFTGRLAAQYALHKYHLHNFNIIKGSFGEPIFPAHIQGSISHVNDRQDYIAVCSVRYSSACDFFIGIDIELNQHQFLLKDHAKTSAVFLGQTELENIKHQQHHTADMALLIFSAKESVIKAIFNKYQKIISFESIIFQRCSEKHLHFQVSNIEKQICLPSLKVIYFQDQQQLITITCIESK